MNNHENDKFGYFASGILLGAVIGSVVALLFAPDSGKRTRKKIQRKSDELMDDVVDYAKYSRDKAEKIVEEGKKRVEELMDEAKTTLKKK
ncbi:MAG TPA: YtxH domain-containing protein [Ignavibacteria bacterium]|nr:YtxH domain-containing protein [Ignavibacteria bacterium]